MGSQTSSHQDPELFNMYEMDWQRGDVPGGLDGVDARSLSVDPATDSASFMARLLPEWQVTVDARDGTLEIFLLGGDLSANGQRVGTAGFVAVPRGSGSCQLASSAGATGFVLWSPGPRLQDSYDGGLHVVRTWEQPWMPETC